MMPSAPELPAHSNEGIFAVVVVYKMRAAETPTVRSLLATVPASDLRLRILVVDNTPSGTQIDGAEKDDVQQTDVVAHALPQGILYQACPSNPGLAEAYNFALLQAKAEGYSWLLTLDQDTNLPCDFFTRVFHAIRSQAMDKRIGSLVGHIVDEGRPVSPFHFARGVWPVVLSADYQGLAPPFASAVNSASLLRIEALESVGGYDARFPLNNSDTSLFHRLARDGWRMFVIPDLVINHQLAIMDRERRMAPARYRQLLTDERAFWDLHMSAAARLERLVKLCGRLAKDLMTGCNRETRGMTFEEIHYRLFTTRRQRLQAWGKAGRGV